MAGLEREEQRFITYQRAARRRIISRSAARLVALDGERERAEKEESGGGDKESTSCAKTSEAAVRSESTREELEGEAGARRDDLEKGMEVKKKRWKKDDDEEETAYCEISKKIVH